MLLLVTMVMAMLQIATQSYYMAEDLIIADWHAKLAHVGLCSLYRLLEADQRFFIYQRIVIVKLTEEALAEREDADMRLGSCYEFKLLIEEDRVLPYVVALLQRIQQVGVLLRVKHFELHEPINNEDQGAARIADLDNLRTRLKYGFMHMKLHFLVETIRYIYADRVFEILDLLEYAYLEFNPLVMVLDHCSLFQTLSDFRTHEA